MRCLLLLLAVTACFGGKSKSSPVTGGLTTSAVIAPEQADFIVPRMLTPGESDQITGVELRGYVGAAVRDAAIPNAYGFTVRQLGEGVTSSIQSGWMVALPAGRSTVFGKLMFDLLSWKRVGEDQTTLSAFSPTLDIGIAPFGRGVCFSGSATWDVHFNQPDRAIVGASVGLCGGRMKR
ncbi:MAG: hypothetical protein H0V17_31650 [Deltaproteobacteria bacterium]|nr:hypothetical protein [Deltaproteobacteria bacterium]